MSQKRVLELQRYMVVVRGSVVISFGYKELEKPRTLDIAYETIQE